MNHHKTCMKAFLSHLALIVTAGGMPASWAHDNCTPYTAVFRLEGPSPFGPLNGGGTYQIGDQPPQPAQVAAVLKDSASFDPAATVVETTFSSMALFAPDASGNLNVLTGIDRVIGTVTGPGTFESITRSRITGGTGVFENVSGRAVSTGSSSVDLATRHTVADINVRGRICGMGEAGDY